MFSFLHRSIVLLHNVQSGVMVLISLCLYIQLLTCILFITNDWLQIFSNIIIFILIALRMSKSPAHVHIWVNCPFKLDEYHLLFQTEQKNTHNTFIPPFIRCSFSIAPIQYLQPETAVQFFTVHSICRSKKKKALTVLSIIL